MVTSSKTIGGLEMVDDIIDCYYCQKNANFTF